MYHFCLQEVNQPAQFSQEKGCLKRVNCSRILWCIWTSRKRWASGLFRGRQGSFLTLWESRPSSLKGTAGPAALFLWSTWASTSCSRCSQKTWLLMDFWEANNAACNTWQLDSWCDDQSAVQHSLHEGVSAAAATACGSVPTSLPTQSFITGMWTRAAGARESLTT